MQPPPQAVPSGLVGPPPAGNPQSMFWSNSPYRRQVNNSAPAAPITSPLQPVTDPFAFSRQTRQNTSLGTSSKSSPPILQGAAPPAFLQRSGQPLPHTNVRDSSQGPCEPPPRLLTQPRPDPSPLPNVLAPSSPAGPEMNRSAEVAPGSEPEVQAPLYPPQYIPGAIPDGSMGGHLHGTVPEPNRPLSRQNPHDSAAVPAASPFFPQTLQQVPGQWGPVQGGPPPSSQPYWPYSEGPVPNMGPQASTVSHSPALSSSCQGSGQEHHSQLVSLSRPLAGDRRNEGVCLQSGNHLVNHFDTENAFRQNPRVGSSPTNQELRLNPGMNKEQLPAFVNPPAQGNSLESHLHAPPGAKASRTLPEVDSGAISMFFQGGETENEENLSSEKTGSAGPSDLDSLSTNLGLGHPSAHAGGLYQAFLKSPSSETMQQGGDMQPYFSQSAGIHHEKQTTKSATMDLWGGGASVGASDASGPQYENVENLDFVQNQEVLPSEPLSLDPSLSDQLRYVSQPGSVVTKHSVGHAGGGALNTEAPDAALYPIRSDSVSSSYSSKSHRSLSGIARPQDLTGTFIQQEVGKPENEASGSFFKQIDSSPIGGEIDGTTISQNYQRNLPQPTTPSPPKPVGIFQTSANSSFEPVKSHLIGVKPVEADRANVVGEVRGTHAHQKQHRPAAAPPDASPGNMEQPPDNMETLFTPQVCPLPLTSPVEPTHRPQHIGGPPLETMLPTPEKRPSTRVHGVMKCESPATTLWAQNELPDFGGNVILAPAAPVLHVPAKLQSSEVIQPPDESVSSQQSQQPDPVPPLQSGDSSGASENLENPPKMGEEDALLSQVMKDAQDQSGLERTQQEPVRPPSQGPKATFTDTSTSGSPLAQGQFQNSAQPPTNPASVDTDQQPLPRPPRSSSASVLSTSSGHAAVRSDQQWPQSPPPEYYYYRSMYDGYQSQYPSLYPPDANTSSLYYQDVYGLYDPRYRGYDSTASTYAENYRHPEPERPSSRASHCSDRPHTRREYPESYYNSKSGWSSHSDYYANYYPGQYDYGDAGHWDRYHYSARFRDPRHYDQRYWYDTEYDPYRKENYSYGDRHDKYDDHWRYDPRVTRSFDEDPEPRRDPYGEETDRRSVHSEHSAQSLRSVASLHSHRSSFSSQSHQSQIYRSHNVATSAYEGPPPPGSFHGDYPYSSYGGGNFSSAQDFTEYGYPPDTSWPTVEQVPSRPITPEKFSVPHVCARFGTGGHLIKVIPNLPSEGQPALVEIHSMETLLQHTPEQEEMRSFPGPLGKDDTHKVDVINFAQNKATKCLQNENLIDKESASLLWNFIVLLCRQNGTVVGTDIAELLLRDHKTVWLPGKSPNEANLIDFTNEAVEQVEEEESGEAQLSFLTDSLTAATSTLEKEIERFRELLLYGRKKDALESAMKNALWGHALLLASKMDSRTHARVMTRFANSLPINDPLQTVYQLMSGRMPAASTCCGDEKWGDWRPHLAMVLSNLSNNMDVESRTMVTMGDTLASKGLLDAAHFCYLMAQVGFGVYTKKTTKLVLIGSNHSLPFLKFASNEAIQRTEAYEYAQSLGAQTCCLPSFQVFKFIYSCRLAEMGLATQAFHYCEVIAKSILIQPHQYSAVLITQLVQVASQLRLFDPQLKEKPEEEAFQEPSWLVQLQHVAKQIKEGSVVWTQDSAFPQQCPSTPSSEVGQCDSQELAQPVGLGTDNPLLAPPMPGSEHFNQSVRLLPSAPQMLPSGHPANPTGMPVFPVLLPSGPVEPGPISAPQGSALSFPETSGPNLAALYPGPGLPPGTSSLPETRSLEPGMMPQEVPDRKPLSELREGNFSGNFANLGPSGMPQDSEQASMWEPPLPAPTPTPEVKRPGQASKKETKEPKKSSESWFFSRWLSGKKRTEAYLPDDKNKSIVWDEKKNRWVDMNEPEEEKKAPPPPPATLPKAPQAVAPGPGGPLRPSVNMFSRKAAGNRARYVDILNPGGTQRNEPTLAPADFFAPLAPLPIPAHLMGPNSETEVPSTAGAIREGQAPPGSPESASEAKVLSSAASLHGSELPPSRVDGSQGGEAPSDPPAVGPPPGGAVPFYNPAQFVPTSATSGNSRAGRIGQRKYPALS